ncbi:MAG: PMT family glycosyltransferase, 4-amino-4-deoxy-L-arabinose transferase [Solidesulfovibrio magneticus str. Maddingley MBC34]|uniref:PMT family glycosyltransferase, 4-amino-4-deoxy-L-arabinose transferase n=1 Tax=Solidesulfovibrio magneticus str. Maddingley MBC34 TaxID=1206767 RepID=K6H6I9_9BACT|nr:MAG: PMT family glycosyltransferase, 4-amino-4-deoxy-L-arabinose transferase [Solidesulfovibrio magneticus str. Maddingley MBC34]
MPRHLPAILLALGLFALALCARLPHLDRESLWEDDWLALDRSSLPLADMAAIQQRIGPARTTYDYQPPLYYAVEHAALGISRSVYVAKLPGVLAGALTAAVLFFLGRSLFSTGAGLAGGLLLAGCLYHVNASRSIKVYALLLLFFTASQLALWTALKRGRTGPWLLYAALAAALPYISYIGLPAVAAQALVGAVFLFAHRRDVPGLPEAAPTDRGRLLRAAIGFALAAAAYLPWLPGLLFIQQTFHNPAARPWEHVKWSLFAEMLVDFGRFAQPQPGPWPLLLAALAGVGLFHALARRRWLELLLTLLPSLVPVVTVITAKTEMNEVLSTRHFVLLLPALLLLAGNGAAAMGALLPRPAWGKTALAGLVAAALAAPQFADLPRLWRHAISYDKELAAYLATARGPTEAIEFFGYKAPVKRFALGWYLDGRIAPLAETATAPDVGYRRVLAVQNSLGAPLFDTPGASPLTDFKVSIFHTRAERLGIVGRAPIVLVPDTAGRFAYADGFDDLRVLADAASLGKLAPDPSSSLLSPTDIQPGVVRYDFLVPDGVSLDAATLAAGFRLYKRHPSHAAPCFADLAISRDGGHFTTVARVTDADFADVAPGPCPSLVEIPLYNTCRKLVRDISLTEALAGSRRFSLRLTLSPGLEEGQLHLDDIALAARLSGTAQPLAGPRAVLERLAENESLDRSDPAIPRLAPGGPFALAATPDAAALPGVAGGPQALAAYKAAHPGEQPVAVLAAASGAPAVELYDPDLAGPRLCLSARQPAVETTGAGGKAQALTVLGRLDAPSFTLSGQTVDIPVAAPAGTTLAVNAGGQGRLWWRPDFSKARFAAMVPDTAVNVRPVPDADNDGGLSCKDASPCRADFPFLSGFPVKRARLTVYPRVANDPEGKNAAHVLVSTDGGASFRPVLSLVSDRSGGWTPLFKPYRLELPLEKTSGMLAIRLEMTGDGAQFWSHARPIDALALTLALDTRALAAFDLPAGPAVMRLTHPGTNAVCYAADTAPIPFPAELERQ